MTYKRHYRVTARFHLGHATLPKETASCTLNFRRSVVDVEFLDPDDWALQSLADQAFDDWAAFLGTSAAMFSNKTFLYETRAYWVGTDNKALGPMKSKIATEPIMGVSAAAGHPWSVSSALTLVGDPGVGKFGRIFLPPQTIPIEAAEGCYSSSNAETVLGACKTFVEAISNRPGIDAGFALVIASGKGEGRLNKVKEIRLGRVPDTQRRRRRDLDENYLVDDVST